MFPMKASTAVAVSSPTPGMVNSWPTTGVDVNKAKVQRRVGADEYQMVSNVGVRFTPDGVEVSIPSSSLPKAIGRVSMRVITCVKLDAEALSVILDRMPEVDQGPAVLEMARGRRTKS